MNKKEESKTIGSSFCFSVEYRKRIKTYYQGDDCMQIFILIISNIINLILGFILQPWLELSFGSINDKAIGSYEILEAEVEAHPALGWATVVIYIVIFLLLNILFLKWSKLKFFKYIKYNCLAFVIGFILSIGGRIF